MPVARPRRVDGLALSTGRTILDRSHPLVTDEPQPRRFIQQLDDEFGVGETYLTKSQPIRLQNTHRDETDQP
jgi:hypothetical protein